MKVIRAQNKENNKQLKELATRNQELIRKFFTNVRRKIRERKQRHEEQRLKASLLTSEGMQAMASNTNSPTGKLLRAPNKKQVHKSTGVKPFLVQVTQRQMEAEMLREEVDEEQEFANQVKNIVHQFDRDPLPKDEQGGAH